MQVRWRADPPGDVAQGASRVIAAREQAAPMASRCWSPAPDCFLRSISPKLQTAARLPTFKETAVLASSGDQGLSATVCHWGNGEFQRVTVSYPAG